MQGSPNSKSKEIIEINYIACAQAKNMQEFSFELKLLNANLNEQASLRKIFLTITDLIIFLKPCLQEDKFFTHNQDFFDKLGGFCSRALYKAQGKKKKIEEEKISTLAWSILTEIFGREINAGNFSAVTKQEILEIFQPGRTIKLRANIKDIDLANFNKIKADLEEKLEQAENKEQSQIVLQAAQTEHTEQTQQETAQNTTNMQVVPVRGLFGYGVTNSGKQITRASIVVAAMRDNLSWFISFTKPFNFFNTVQFFFRHPPKLPMQKRKAITWHSEPQEQKHIGDEVDGRKRDRIASVISHFPGVGPAIGCVASYVLKEIDQSRGKKAEQLCQLGKSAEDQDIGQTTSRIDRFKAKRKKSKVKIEQTQEQLEEKQHIIVLAQNNARLAMIDRDANQQKRTLDEIFVEIISEYKNQDPETFRNIFNSVFNVVYSQDKRLHKILETDEVSEVLETLPIRKPMNNSFLDKEYLQEIAYKEKKQLLRLVTGIYQQQPENSTHKSTNPPPSNIEKNQTPRPPTAAAKAKKARTPPATNTAFKSSLETVFSSKEAYFCLFVIGVSISILCLWHLPLGKVPILQSLVQEGKREYIGWTLSIGLSILILFCIVNLAHFVHSEYNGFSVESVKRINANKSLPGT